MEKESSLSSPDEEGWYWFKKTKKHDPVIVYVNENGICFAMDSFGKSWELDDQIGSWFPIENLE